MKIKPVMADGVCEEEKLSVPRKPWDRRESESLKAFQAFTIYLHQGFERSVRGVGRETGKDRTLIDRWSSRHKWVERVKLWEDEQTRLRDQADAKESMNKGKVLARRRAALEARELALSELMMNKSEAMLKFPLERQVSMGGDGTTTVIEPANWSMQSAARLADVGSTLGRRANGDDGKIKVEHSGDVTVTRETVFTIKPADTRDTLRLPASDNGHASGNGNGSHERPVAPVAPEK